VKFTRVRTRVGRIAAVAVCVLGFAVPLSVAIPSTAAHAAGACSAILLHGNEWDVPYGCTNVPIPGSHECAQIGEDPTSTEGVYTTANECADIYANNTSGQKAVRGVGEFYCQGEYPQCQGMNVTVDLWFAPGDGGSYTLTPVNYKCNPSPGPACPTSGREYVYTQAGDQDSGGDCITAYSFLPADGWDGHNQVISVKGDSVAFHMGYQENSAQTDVCFET
jgi:hypothetical protein